MPIDINVLIGGAAGQGIQTVGDLLVGVCRRAGLYVFAVNDYESRIRGGHSFVQLRISDHPIQAPCRPVHLVVAMDEETRRRHRDRLVSDGTMITDGSDMDADAAGADSDYAVPMTAIAEDAGGKIMANTVAAGVCLALLGAPEDLFAAALQEQFVSASDAVRQKNLTAAQTGYQALGDTRSPWAFEWPAETAPRITINGARSLALGALAADCRIGAFYPMSPATGIMQALSELSDTYPLIVEQAEDEIAAVNMIIGASFAGVRALTATSGGGFCLMTEGLGLAGITETPVVIINSQRPGPATGLPTRTAQGDLLFVINAAQDEFPRFVFAPTTAQDAFNTMIRAFDLSDKYQVPAIILTDHFFNDALCTMGEPFTAPQSVDHHIVTDDDLEAPSAYQRFALTENGISPRALPCRGRALVAVTGNEHPEDGHISEDKANRVSMMDKRFAKADAMTKEMRPPQGRHASARTLLMGWGSTAGVIEEAVARLREKQVDVGSLIFSDIWPFPADAVISATTQADRIIMVEANATAQLGRLMRQETGRGPDETILKYDGRPFTPEDILDGYNRIGDRTNG